MLKHNRHLPPTYNHPIYHRSSSMGYTATTCCPADDDTD